MVKTGGPCHESRSSEFAWVSAVVRILRVGNGWNRTNLDLGHEFESLDIALDLVARYKCLCSLVLLLNFNPLDEISVPFRVHREVE